MVCGTLSCDILATNREIGYADGIHIHLINIPMLALCTALRLFPDQVHFSLIRKVARTWGVRIDCVHLIMSHSKLSHAHDPTMFL